MPPVDKSPVQSPKEKPTDDKSEPCSIHFYDGAIHSEGEPVFSGGGLLTGVSYLTELPPYFDTTQGRATLTPLYFDEVYPNSRGEARGGVTKKCIGGKSVATMRKMPHLAAAHAQIEMPTVAEGPSVPSLPRYTTDSTERKFDPISCFERKRRRHKTIFSCRPCATCSL